MIAVLHVPAFRDNYIWLILDRNRTSAIAVDPGDAAPVQAVLENTGLRLAAIFCTHHHADHSGGIPALTQDRAIPVYGPAREPVSGMTHPVREGDRVSIPGFAGSFGVLDIPGHTAGHVAFYDDERLFCGDTLFSAGCGRVFEGNPAQLYASLQKLATLNDEVQVYCGHEYTLANLRFAMQIEPDNLDLLVYYEDVERRRAQNDASLPSTVGLERRVNPFLRAGEPTIRQTVEKRTGRKSDTPADIFAILRRWKDDFKG